MTIISSSRQLLLFASLLGLLSPAHSDNRRRWYASRSSTFNFGSCDDPRITWGYNIDGSEQFGFAPTDQNQFPHGFSSDISTLEVYICNHLQSVCNASPTAIRACRNAFERYSGLSGQNAADSWNEALGLYGIMPSQTQTEYGTTTTAVATVLLSGTSVPYSTLFSAISTVYSESMSSSVLSSHVSPTYTTYSIQTISQDPVSKSDVQTTISPTTTSTSTVVLPGSLPTSSTDSISTSIIVPTGGSTVTTIKSYVSTPTAVARSSSIGSEDGGGSPFSGTVRVLEPLSIFTLSCFVIPALIALLL